MQQLLIRIALQDAAAEVWSALSGMIGVALVIVLVVLFVPLALVASLLSGPMRLLPGGGASPPAAILPPGAPFAPPATVPPPTSGIADSRIVDIARQYLGVPYVFGGTDPAHGLDCSGLAQLVFRRLGIALPRTAQQQYDATARIAREQLQPGDLVFFARTYADPHDWITHVGIYIGDGLQINAPTDGQVVSIQPVFTGFWGSHFAGGGRP